jgi:hypothetical protein
MVLNVLRGVPSAAEELVTPRVLAAAVGNKQWMGETRENGEGVTFAEMRKYLEQSLRVYGLEDYEIEVFRPAAASSHDLEKLSRCWRKTKRATVTSCFCISTRACSPEIGTGPISRPLALTIPQTNGS